MNYLTSDGSIQHDGIGQYRSRFQTWRERQQATRRRLPVAPQYRRPARRAPRRPRRHYRPVQRAQWYRPWSQPSLVQKAWWMRPHRFSVMMGGLTSGEQEQMTNTLFQRGMDTVAVQSVVKNFSRLKDLQSDMEAVWVNITGGIDTVQDAVLFGSKGEEYYRDARSIVGNLYANLGGLYPELQGDVSSIMAKIGSQHDELKAETAQVVNDLSAQAAKEEKARIEEQIRTGQLTPAEGEKAMLEAPAKVKAELLQAGPSLGAILPIAAIGLAAFLILPGLVGGGKARGGRRRGRRRRR